jgi:GTP cyclohydrolase IA
MTEEKKRLIAEKMREVMILLGLDLQDTSLKQTPERIAKMYVDEIFWGLDPNHFPNLTFQEENIPHELVLVKNISFVSFCEHHFVPIVGKAHVGYFPHKRLLGLSKVPRLIHYFAKRPQVQERLTAQIAEALAETLETEDVAVVLHAIHFCVLARGVEDRATSVETHILKGCFEDPTIQSTFFTRIATSEDEMSFT